METIENTIRKMINKTSEDVRSKLMNGGKGQTSLYKSFKIELDKQKGEKVAKYSIKVNLTDSAKWVDSGRKPGKMPPIGAIEAWCRKKGIVKEAAFPISRNIGKRGIKATPFLFLFKKLAEDFKKAIPPIVKVEVVKTIKDEIKNMKKK